MKRQVFTAIFHGINRDVNPISYKDRNHTVIIACGTDGETSQLNPIAWFLQYFSQLYDDFVEEFLEFHYRYLGDDYTHTYNEKTVASSKYAEIFKWMMKEHFLFLGLNPLSKLQIFGRFDSIANLTLIANEDVDVVFSLPIGDQFDQMKNYLNDANFHHHFNYDVVSKTKGAPPFYSEKASWINVPFIEHHHLVPMALSDRLMNIIPLPSKLTNIKQICDTIPDHSYLILTACRNADQVLKSQIYKPKASLQQITSKLQALRLSSKKRQRQKQQQLKNTKKSKN